MCSEAGGKITETYMDVKKYQQNGYVSQRDKGSRIGGGGGEMCCCFLESCGKCKMTILEGGIDHLTRRERKRER